MLFPVDFLLLFLADEPLLAILKERQVTLRGLDCSPPGLLLTFAFVVLDEGGVKEYQRYPWITGENDYGDNDDDDDGDDDGDVNAQSPSPWVQV